MDYIAYEIFEEKFIYFFQKYNILKAEAENKIIKNFYILYKRIITENQKYNLTSITEANEVILKHFLDSAMILKYLDLPSDAKIIDIGTGAGFPALPIYIMRNDLKITFLDSSAKKINFISDTVQMLDMPDISGNTLIYHCGRAEDIARQKDFRETYDFAVSRAVAKLNVLCELAAPLIKTGGHFVSYKGRNAEAETAEAKNAIKILGLEIKEIHEFSISKDYTESELECEEENRRSLIDIIKIKNTSQVYPRNYAKITKTPL